MMSTPLRFKKLYNTLSSEPVKYFEDKLGKLDKTQTEGIRELFKKSSLLKTMKYTIDNTEYKEFNEDQALKDFHQALKDFIKENEKSKK